MQVTDLEPPLRSAMQERLDRLATLDRDIEVDVKEIAAAWEEHARPTLAMLRGIADGLGMDWAPLFRYTIASYIEDRAAQTTATEGCTVWAAAAPVTAAATRRYSASPALRQRTVTATPT